MREFRIKLPDRKDGRRWLGAAGERVGDASSHALDKAQQIGGRARERVGEASSQALDKAQALGGRVHDRVDDLEAPRINLIDARRLGHATRDRLGGASALLQAEHDVTAS